MYQSSSLLAERRFYDLGFQVTPPDLDTDFRPGFCKFRFHIPHTDTFLQNRRHGSGCHHTDDVAFGIGNLIAVTGNTFVYQLEGTQLAANAFFLLAFQFGAIGEVLAFGELGDPTQTGFDRRSRVVEIVAIQTEAHFQT